MATKVTTTWSMISQGQLSRFLVLALVYCTSHIGINASKDTQRKSGSSDNPASDCHTPLGVANPGLIPLFWLQASDGFAYRGRLGRKYAWLSRKPTYSEVDLKVPSQYAWIQVDLRRPTLVTGLQTQGAPLQDSWVTWYSLYHSADCERFSPVVNAKGYITRFIGNNDADTVATTLLPDPVVARCVRVVPLRAEGNHTGLRMELLGCDVRMCREAVILHLASDITFTDTNVSAISRTIPGHDSLSRPYGKRNPLSTIPTLMKRGYAEFKFHTEQLVFGLVLHGSDSGDPQRASAQKAARFMLMYSRNCQHWAAVREGRRAGDPVTFTEDRWRSSYSWHTLPYPVRAQCVRVIPVSTRYTETSPIRAHFIGCGTGPGSAATCGVRKTVTSSRHRVRRVIGGSVTSEGEWPWLVTLQVEEADVGFYHVCGASLIHPQWLMTALHCVNVMYYRIFKPNDTATNFTDPEFLNNVKIVIGRHNLNTEQDTDIVAEAESIIGHPEFNGSYFIHDIALVKLSRPVRLSDHAAMVCLPTIDDLFNNTDDCRVIGWGKISNGKLPSRPHQVSVDLYDFEHCQSIFAHLNITEDMLCAGSLDGSVDACFGDSGGPLMCERAGHWYQAGIVSWNIGCALDGYPGVYSDVRRHVTWVDSVLEEDRRSRGLQ